MESCPTCEGPVVQSLGKGRRRTYCSPTCQQVAYRERRNPNAARTRHRRDARVGRICTNPECGQLIPIERKLGAKFCSNECYRRGQSFRLYKNGWMRQHLYGITPEDYEVLLAVQDGRCAICRALEPGGKGGWHVDHCHDSKAIRGLLCHFCNIMLGNAKDDPETLRAAARYLEDSS